MEQKENKLSKDKTNNLADNKNASNKPTTPEPETIPDIKSQNIESCYPLRNKYNPLQNNDRSVALGFNINPMLSIDNSLYRENSFNNQNLWGYNLDDYSNTYTQRYRQPPPLPMRNDYSRFQDRGDSYYNNDSQYLKQTCQLRSSMKMLPLKPLYEEIAIRQYNESKDELEEVLIQLVNTSDFNLIDLFRIFDTKCNGFTTTSDLFNGLESFGYLADKRSIYNFIQRFDNDRTGNLKYSDFCDAFIPKDCISAQKLKAKPPYNIYTYDYKDKYFSAETRELIKEALKIHFMIV